MNTGRGWTGAILLGIVSSGLSIAAPATPGFEERVDAQRAIQEVYRRHRIGATESPSPGAGLPDEALRRRVEDALLQGEVLATHWGVQLSPDDLQSEVERMIASTRAPGVLRELFDALENDSDLIVECLARPALTDRWIRRLYAGDARLHADSRRTAEEALEGLGPGADLRSLGGEYAETLWVLDDGSRSTTEERDGELRVRVVGPESWSRLRSLPPGEPGPLEESADRFFIRALLEQTDRSLRVATVGWPKRSFDDWWSEMRDSSAAGALVGAASVSSTSPGVAGDAGWDANLTECTPDSWTPTATTGAPSPRAFHTAVWTGAEMIVWGGWDGTFDLNTGGRYDPATDTWTPTATTGAPAGRDSHTAVWSGTQMIAWGGVDGSYVRQNTGGRYDPASNTWAATSTTGAPTGRSYHTAVWTGTKMVVWGGVDDSGDQDTGGRYDPVGDGWEPTATSRAPRARDSHTAVWAGGRMVVWGGVDANYDPLGTGSRYDPVADSWSATSTNQAPGPRAYHTAVSTGGKMIVWGGWDGVSDRNTGAVYDPAADAWTPTSTTGAPLARDVHTAVWSGTEMIVWGGRDDVLTRLQSGGRYDPVSNAWTPTSTTGAPSPRDSHGAVWGGAEMLVWGGADATDYFGTGGAYCAGGCGSPPPTGTPSVTLAREAGGSRISWTSLAGATGYDLVRGSLGTLRGTGGNFTSATEVCLSNDGTAQSYLDSDVPIVGAGYWYLVRGMNCGGAGTYDEPAGSQTGSRDTEIAASAAACP